MPDDSAAEVVVTLRAGASSLEFTSGIREGVLEARRGVMVSSPSDCVPHRTLNSPTMLDSVKAAGDATKSPQVRLNRMRTIVAVMMFGLLAPMGSSAADLTQTEMRWLQGVWPVVAFAKEARMPLDIVVQPQQAPGEAPLGLAFVDGRCKLVLSMRGNPEATAALERIEPDLRDAALELMAAHELGHCRRYLDGAWHDMPARFSDGASSAVDQELGAASAQTRAARLEEGYGDLVGLAWSGRHHPGRYAQLHAWLVRERSMDRVDGSPHDTLAWVTLAQDKALLDGGSMFAAAASLWTRGLGAGN